MNLDIIKTELESCGFANVIVRINENDDNDLEIGGIFDNQEPIELGFCIHHLKQFYNDFKMSTTYNNETLEVFIVDVFLRESTHIFMQREVKKNKK